MWLPYATAPMPRVSQRSVARHGVAVGGVRTDPEVMAALIAEAKRLQRSPAHVVGWLLRYWLEDVYRPAQAAKNKPNPK